MSLKKVQKDVEEWTSQFNVQYWQPHEILARLMEETGELAREINHKYGPKKKKESEDAKDLSDEMADIIFTLGCLANSLNVDLDEAWERVMDKCYKRDSQRYERKK
ncbi:MAG: nucleotide pyrophosphohydrolase [Candidatus Nanoarchaeia archaeon]|nr:nucleotide pyrophosphohydrolase [Candidatus Nanoarchaeia archaeon]